MLSVVLVAALVGTSPPAPSPGGGTTPENVGRVDCSVYSGTQYWYEHSCPDHTGPNVSFCLEQVNREGESTIENDLDHTEAPWSIIVIFGCFAVGALVRYIFMDTSVPYTVVLFVIGMGWGGLGAGLKSTSFKRYVELGDMNPHLIFHIFLPVLIFESAFAMQIPVFKKVVWQCLFLAGPGLALASLLTAMVAKYAFTEYEWTWPACLLLGTILSATDPVAVVALLKELGASPVISTMIEGESLFNDGTAIVFFAVLKEAVVIKNCDAEWGSCYYNEQISKCQCTDYSCSIPLTGGEILLQFLKVSLGGPLIGLIVGWVAVLCLQRVFNDSLIEITITLVTAYITFFVAEGLFGVSGVLGVVTCGLLLSYYRHSISPEVEHTMHHFWEIVVYLTNTMIFLLAGMIVSLKALDGDLGGIDVLYLAIIYGSINFIRVFVLFVSSPILGLFPYKLSVGEYALVAWGGLRGAVGLALALIIQADVNVVPASVRSKFVFHVAGIVILTLVFNGTTTRKVVEGYQLNKIPDRNKRMMTDRFKELLSEMNQTVLDLRSQPLYYDTNWSNLEQIVSIENILPPKHVDPYNKKGERIKVTADMERDDAKHVYLNTVEASVHQQYGSGTLETESARNLLHMVDVMRNTKADEDPENPDCHLKASNLAPYFELPSFISDPVTATGLKMYYLQNKWRRAFSMTIGYKECHDLVASRAFSLLKRNDAGKLITQCKRNKSSANDIAENAIVERADISCMIKDRYELLKMIEQQMKQLRKFPSTLEPCSAEAVLVDTPWFVDAEEDAQDELLDMLKEGRASLVEVDAHMRIDSKTEGKELSGLFVIVSGVVQVRVGLYMTLFSSGPTMGLQQLLTPNSVSGRRFSDCWTETKTRLLYIPYHAINPMFVKYKQLASALWHEAGFVASSILMKMEKRFQTPLFTRRRMINLSKTGKIELVQDPNAYVTDAVRQIRIPAFCTVLMLRGKCWEYEIDAEKEEDDPTRVNEHRFPCIIPSTFKFAKFTNHATLYIIPDEKKTGDSARRLWGTLNAMVRAIHLWVGLRGDEYRRNALATFFKREPREVEQKRLSVRSSLKSSIYPLQLPAEPVVQPPIVKEQINWTSEALLSENRALQAALSAHGSPKATAPPPSLLSSLSRPSPFFATPSAEYNRLTELSSLHDQGVLSPDEFKRSKRKLLGLSNPLLMDPTLPSSPYSPLPSATPYTPLQSTDEKISELKAKYLGGPGML